MPTIIVDARVTRQDGDLLFLELERDGQQVEITTFPGTPLTELAVLILAQQMPITPDDTFQRRWRKR